MITRTIGSGGSFPELGAAITWLKAQGSLSDDYTFWDISKYTITTNEIGIIGPINGNTVEFTADREGGYEITTEIQTYFIISSGASPENDATILFKNKTIINTYGPVTARTLFNIIPLGITGGTEGIVKISYDNIIMINNSVYYPTRIVCIGLSGLDRHEYTTCTITNSKFYGFQELFQIFAFEIILQIIIENVICDYMKIGIRFLPYAPTAQNVTLRNVVSMRTQGRDDWELNTDSIGLLIENCADSDNTLDQGSNNQHNINPTLEFQSLDPNFDSYLKLTPGTVTNGIYTPGAPQLGQTGIQPEYAGNTDIAGESRPDAGGWFSIGPHSQLYIERTIEDIYNINPVNYKNNIDLLLKKKAFSVNKIIITNRNNEIVSDDNQYTSYDFDTQYGSLASIFNCSLVNNKADIEPGYGIQLLIDGKIKFRGVIQRKNHVVSKDSNLITLSGKDRSGILVESYCNTYKDYNSTSPADIIDGLIAQTNFYVKQKGTIDETADSTGFNNATDISSRNSAILHDLDNSDTLNERADITTYDAVFLRLSAINHFKIDIGDRVYQKIEKLVKSQGYEVMYMPDGTLYIGDLGKKRGYDKTIYKINNKITGEGNNVLSSNLMQDISGRYSTISISSQSEGYQYSSTFPNVNEEKIATDSTLPGKKFYAEQINDVHGAAAKYAIRIREDQRIEGYQLIYEVPGHVAENGETWEINRYVNIYDDMNEIYRHLVLYGRTFSFDYDSGHRTMLRISHERKQELAI
jgi:prophage tail gpP-like protein